MEQIESATGKRQGLEQKYGFLQTHFTLKDYETLFRLHKSRHNVQLLGWVAFIMVLMAVVQFIIFMSTLRVSGW